MTKLIRTFLNLLAISLLSVILFSCSKTTYYESDLKYACSNSDYKLVQKCLKQGISPELKITDITSHAVIEKLGDASLPYESYLLHSAVINGDYKAIKLLLRYGASGTSKDSFGNTALHVSIKLQDYDAFKLLKNDSAALNAVDNLGNSPLLTAIALNDPKLYSPLIKTENALIKQNNLGESAIMIAAKNHNRDLEKKLLKEGINIDLRDINGNSLLMKSVLEEDIDEITFLLANSADVNIVNKEKKNALALAAEKGNKEISTLLLNAHVDIDNTSTDGKSVLMTAVEKNDLTLVCDLLLQGSNVNLQDNLGNTALILATKNNNLEIIEKLLEKNANLDLTDIDNRSALFYSLSAKSFDISKILIENGAEVNLTNSSDVPFIYNFLLSNDTDFSKLLIDNNVDINFVDDFEREPLLIAVENENPDIVESLILRKVDIDLVDNNDKDILFIAIDNNDIRSTKALLNGGADPNVYYEDSPLIVKAISDKNNELLNILIDAGADVNIDYDDESLLAAAVSNNNELVANALIRGGANGYVKNANNLYLLEEALNNKNYSICLKLFDCPDVELIKESPAGKNYLVETVNIKDATSLQKLLSFGMNPNEVDKNRNSLLTLALMNRDLECVKILVENGASSNISNKDGLTSRNYLAGQNIRITYEVGKTIYHYTDAGVIIFSIILLILLVLFIIYKIIDCKKINKKWELINDERFELNKKQAKKSKQKETNPRKIFQVIHLFDQIANISNQKDINRDYNSIFIALLRAIFPFNETREIYNNFFEEQYVKQVTEKYDIKDFSLDKKSLKLKYKNLKKIKNNGIELKRSILVYIYLLYNFTELKLTPDQLKLLCSYLGYSKLRNKKKILKILHILENTNKYCDSTVLEFITQNQNYIEEKTFNIAVCATMSSGKSTFINALLGSDCLPARNEATTALITTVYDLDGMTKTIGYSTKSDIPSDISNDANLIKINEWNDASDCYNHVYLQGDFDCISCENRISVINDTPGTNNSGDRSHHDITMDFLSSKKLNAIIFVVNAEHVSTTDEKTLLSEIYKNKISKDKTPIIFALNKADCIDNEKEDISEIIRKYKDYLNTIGFDNPKVYPVSAKAARLLKMASKEKGNNFSKMEQREFALCLSEFLEDYDFSSTNEETNNVDSMITVGQKDFSKNEILTALNRTGINAIEKEIESLF